MIELVEEIIEVPHDLAEELRTLPQVPDQWLDKMRVMLQDNPSGWSVISKVKFTRAFIKSSFRTLKRGSAPHHRRMPEVLPSKN